MGLSHTVSGDIASFRTPSRVPIESLKFHFLPKQAAGTPSPENPIPIEGWTGLNGRRAGKNLLPNDIVAGTEHSQGLTFVQNSDGSIRITGKGNNTTTKLAVIKNFPNGAFPLKAGTYRPHIWSTDTTKSQIYISIMYNNGDNSMYCNANGNSYTYTISEDVYVNQIRIGLQPSENVEFDLTIYPSLEKGSTPTSWEPCRSEHIPITFPNGETIYGGYIDPVAGEIVAEYYLARAKKSDFGDKSTPSGTGRDYRQTQSIFPKTDSGVEWAIARQQQKFNRGIIANPWSEASYGENIGVIVTQDSMNPVITYMRISEEVYQAMNDDDYAEISYKLREPIHIPIPAQDMKAFLDHNNFWSDANDITEVTYPVTESKDILATRKKAMEFDIGHRRKVRWNQLARDISTSHWRMYSSNALRGTISDGIAECYYVTNKQYQRYSASVTTINSISWDADHYYYASYMVKPTYDGKFGIEFARGKQIQGMANVNANEWKRACTKQKPQSTGFSDLYIPFPAPVGSIDEGYQVKAPFVVDLTLMFGAGNEPATQTEFERICELNGIDLTTYQPYDEGSDRWLIIP